MRTETLDVEFTAPEVGTKLALFQPTDAAIADMAKRYMPLAIRDLDDAEGFKLVHAARMHVKACRVQVKKTRKALKADALEYGRRVDGEAARITAALDPIETHLETQEKRITDERERIKREAAEAEQRKLEAEAKAKREAEEAAAKAIRDAEEARLKVEREKIEAERRELEAQRASAEAERRKVEAAQQAERDRLAAEQRAITEAKEKADRAEFERLAKIKAEQEARERVEREKAAEEARKIEQAAVIEAERLRIEAMRPDVEKIKAMGAVLRSIQWPTVTSSRAIMHVAQAQAVIDALAIRCEGFSA